MCVLCGWGVYSGWMWWWGCFFTEGTRQGRQMVTFGANYHEPHHSLFLLLSLSPCESLGMHTTRRWEKLCAFLAIPLHAVCAHPTSFQSRSCKVGHHHPGAISPSLCHTFYSVWVWVWLLARAWTAVVVVTSCSIRRRRRASASRHEASFQHQGQGSQREQ